MISIPEVGEAEQAFLFTIGGLGYFIFFSRLFPPMPTTPNTHPKDKSFSSPYQPGANRAYMTIPARWCMWAEKRLIWVEGRVIVDQQVVE